MKAAVAMNPKYYARRPTKAKPFPNAAERKKYIEQAVDFVLGFAICAAVATILLFALALG